MFDDVLKHRSGRVIALARAVLASIFLIAISVDPTQPVQATTVTYAMLGTYVVAALGIALLTWKNWWLDAKLAAPMHVVDIALFTLLVLTTDGYTSPFFVFFVFLVLSAAIRWGWRQTALTATIVILIFFAVGLSAASAEADFGLQRFIIRSGNLVILSALLIWFGVNHGFGVRVTKDDLLRDLSLDDAPLEIALDGAARVTRAAAALLVWRESGRKGALVVSLENGRTAVTALAAARATAAPQRSFLFDLPRNRALARGPHSGMVLGAAEALLDVDLVCKSGIESGLAVPVRTDAGEGLLLLGGVRSLCTDHIEFGETLGRAVADHIQRHALLTAVQDGATARARLSLARDLHDSIVQFLAGATFRVEAISRTLGAGDKAAIELKDLKELLLQEQQELRSAIGALRSDRIPLPRLAVDLKALCARLARQWDINCTFDAEVPETSAPMRLHQDTHQLIREAVANAVRHARAKRVDVQLTAEETDLRLEITNDGSGGEKLKDGGPWSLRERVGQANGTLILAGHETGATVSITLPLDLEPRT